MFYAKTPSLARGNSYQNHTNSKPYTAPMQLSPALRERIHNALQSFAVQPLPPNGRSRAAVALVIADEGLGAALPGMTAHSVWSSQAAVILTRRALHLRNHAGQWALPGGRMEAGESPAQAALRETQEEIGLQLNPVQVLGCLDDYATRSGFVITPVVIWAGAVHHLHPNPDEVASIHRIPLTELLRSDAPMLETTTDAPHPILCMPLGDSWVAAPTAAFLYQLREVCLRGLPTRVAHFDQPRFAWR